MQIFGWCIFLSILAPIGYASCDPTRFSHNCEMPYIQKQHKHLAQVYCGPRLGHITKHQYEILKRYHRANTNMILTLNGEYIDSPCIPGGKY